MRTTMVLDDAMMRDVAGRAAAQGRSLKAVINEALALGLHRMAGTVPRWSCPTYILGGERADYTKAWALVDGLEADAVAEKLERRQ